MNTTDKGLLTPDNCTVVFVDCQPLSPQTNDETGRQVLLNNLLLLAKAAKIFGVPVILTTIGSGALNGEVIAPLSVLFPERAPIVRTSLNAWDSAAVVAAINQSRRRNIILASLSSESSLVFPALQMLEGGYGVYVVEDALGGTTRSAKEAGIRRMEQAGAVSLTALQVLLELKRDWARREHDEELRAAVKAHSSAFGQSLVFAATAPS